jgi:hypothetical protein
MWSSSRIRKRKRCTDRRFLAEISQL